MPRRRRRDTYRVSEAELEERMERERQETEYPSPSGAELVERNMERLEREYRYIRDDIVRATGISPERLTGTQPGRLEENPGPDVVYEQKVYKRPITRIPFDVAGHRVDLRLFADMDGNIKNVNEYAGNVPQSAQFLYITGVEMNPEVSYKHKIKKTVRDYLK